jgi:hypothetical protein
MRTPLSTRSRAGRARRLALACAAVVGSLAACLAAGPVGAASGPAPGGAQQASSVSASGRLGPVGPAHSLRLPSVANTRPQLAETFTAPLGRTAGTPTAGPMESQLTSSAAPLALQSGAGTTLSGQEGLSDQETASDQTVTPPNPDIAVGPQWVVETTNESIYIRQRTGAAYPEPPGAVCPPPVPASAQLVTDSLGGCDQMDLNDFVYAPGWELSDPHILYDPGAGQFYLSFFITTTPAPGQSCLPGYEPAGETCSIVFVLHTTGGDPTGQWEGYYFYSYYADAITDQPMIGFSGDKVGVSWDEFNVATLHWDGDEFFVMSKSLFLGNTTDPIIDPLSTQLGAPTTSFFSLYPVSDISEGSTLYFVSNDGSGDLPGSGPGPSLFVLGVTGNTPGTVGQTYHYPGITESELPPAAPQSGSTYTIDTDDDRINAGILSNGALWTGFDEGCTEASVTVACIRYIEASVSTSGSPPTTVVSILHNLDVGISGAYVYYPSFGIDPAGDLLSTFTTSSSSTYPSLDAVGLVAGAAQLSAPVTVESGTGPYFVNGLGRYYTNTGACSSVNDPVTHTTACRFGDYAGGAMDPEYPEDFWFANEIQLDSAHPDDWGTAVGRLTYSGPSIANLTPAVGPTTGGTGVTVNGSDFGPASTFTFAGSPVTASSITPNSFTFIAPAHAAGSVNGSVTDSLGSSALASYLYVPPSRYQPLTPYRVLDTRTSTCVQCTGGSFGSGQTRSIQVGGFTPSGYSGTVVPASATAVVLNVTAVSGSQDTYLALFPAGGAVPTASTLNANPQQVIANLTTVALGPSGGNPGYVNIFNAAGTIDIVVDVEGYYLSGGSGTAGEFHALSPPVRVCDTRGGQGTACNPGTSDPLTAGQSRLVAVTDGTTGVSTGNDAEAVVLNLTAVSGSTLTYLTVYPPTPSGAGPPTCGAPPAASNLNVSANTNQPNRVVAEITPYGGTGYVCVFNDLGTINVVVDVNGWFGNGSDTGGALFYALGPSRICDTRYTQGTQCAGEPRGPGQTVAVQIDGTYPLPATGIVALVANVTAVSGTAATFLTVYPDVASTPVTSDLNPPAFTNIANCVIVAVPADGRIDVYNSLGTIDFIIDAVGWFQ